MRLWRISNYADLSGTGGLRYSARWHTKGHPIIYSAEHPAGALIEFLAYIDLENIPETFQLVTIEIDADVTGTAIEPRQLRGAWITDTGVSRAIGDEWLMLGTSLLLRVPSAIVPDAYNMLINPNHPDADKMRITKTERVPLDRRLARG